MVCSPKAGSLRVSRIWEQVEAGRKQRGQRSQRTSLREMNVHLSGLGWFGISSTTRAGLFYISIVSTYKFYTIRGLVIFHTSQCTLLILAPYHSLLSSRLMMGAAPRLGSFIHTVTPLLLLPQGISHRATAAQDPLQIRISSFEFLCQNHEIKLASFLPKRPRLWYFPYMSIYAVRSIRAHVTQGRDQRTACESQRSPSSVWVLGTKLSSLGYGAFTCWHIPSALGVL